MPGGRIKKLVSEGEWKVIHMQTSCMYGRQRVSFSAFLFPWSPPEMTFRGTFRHLNLDLGAFTEADLLRGGHGGAPSAVDLLARDRPRVVRRAVWAGGVGAESKVLAPLLVCIGCE